jgi:hypothetical protein
MNGYLRRRAYGVFACTLLIALLSVRAIGQTQENAVRPYSWIAGQWNGKYKATFMEFPEARNGGHLSCRYKGTGTVSMDISMKQAGVIAGTITFYARDYTLDSGSSSSCPAGDEYLTGLADYDIASQTPAGAADSRFISFDFPQREGHCTGAIGNVKSACSNHVEVSFEHSEDGQMKLHCLSMFAGELIVQKVK